MALINCNECGQMMSDEADNCPHCGFQLQRQQYYVSYVQTANKDFIQLFTIVSYICAAIYFLEIFTLDYFYETSFVFFWNILTYIFIGIQTIMFLWWFYQIAKNAKLFNPHFEYAPYWAWLSWFIPIFNFFRPYQIMKSIWESTDKLIGNRDTLETEKKLMFWWGVELTSFITYFYLIYLIMNDDTYSSFYHCASFLSSVASIVSCIIEIHLIKVYSKKELLIN